MSLCWHGARTGVQCTCIRPTACWLPPTRCFFQRCAGASYYVCPVSRPRHRPRSICDLFATRGIYVPSLGKPGAHAPHLLCRTAERSSRMLLVAPAVPRLHQLRCLVSALQRAMRRALQRQSTQADTAGATRDISSAHLCAVSECAPAQLHVNISCESSPGVQPPCAAAPASAPAAAGRRPTECLAKASKLALQVQVCCSARSGAGCRPSAGPSGQGLCGGWCRAQWQLLRVRPRAGTWHASQVQGS